MQCSRPRDQRAPRQAQAGGSTETLFFSLIPARTIMGISGMKSGGSVTSSWDEVQENPSAWPEAGLALLCVHHMVLGSIECSAGDGQ